MVLAVQKKSPAVQVLGVLVVGLLVACGSGQIALGLMLDRGRLGGSGASEYHANNAKSSLSSGVVDTAGIPVHLLDNQPVAGAKRFSNPGGNWHLLIVSMIGVTYHLEYF